MKQEGGKVKSIWCEVPEGTDGFPSQTCLTNCYKCNRKIIVAIGLFGIPHHSDPVVWCGECFELDAKWAEQNPDKAKEIKEWLEE